MSSPDAVDLESGEIGPTNSMLSMGGAQHRRYRGLVQPSFSPTRASWWIENWIDHTVNALIDSFETQGRAELNVEFCAAIPVLTITGSFAVPVAQALDVRESLARPEQMVAIIAPIVAARREHPEDDLISVLVESEITDEDGRTHRLTDAEIYSFSMLLLAAGSGTTWKQMGITLAALLQRPELLEAVRQDRSLLRPVIEESLRWQPTDPMFSRWVTKDDRVLRHEPSEGSGPAYLPRCGEPGPRTMGEPGRITTPSVHQSPRWPSATGLTSASASTSLVRR